jgi:hypothetical protein
MFGAGTRWVNAAPRLQTRSRASHTEDRKGRAKLSSWPSGSTKWKKRSALQRVVNHCRRIGKAKLAIQLAHAGRKASAQRPWEGGKALSEGEDPWPTIGPSALPFGAGWHTPRAATEADMARVRTAFADAAKRALRIGYLLHSWLSPLANKRNDEWGGPLANRMRFPLDVVRSTPSSCRAASRSAPALPAVIGRTAVSLQTMRRHLAKCSKTFLAHLRHGRITHGCLGLYSDACEAWVASITRNEAPEFASMPKWVTTTRTARCASRRRRRHWRCIGTWAKRRVGWQALDRQVLSARTGHSSWIDHMLAGSSQK